MTQKRILILSTSYLPLIGGSELAIESIAKELGDFEFDIITSRSKLELPAKEHRGNVTIYRVGNPLALKRILLPKLFLPLVIFNKARQLNRINNYKIIHAYQVSQAAGAAWLFKLFNPGVRFILTIQEGKDLKSQSWLIRLVRHIIIRKADWVTAISKYLKDFAQATKHNLQVSIIPNGVDLDLFTSSTSSVQKEQIKARYDVHSDQKIIITASRLVPKNGPMQLLEAFAQLIPHKNLVLIIAGSGKLENDILNKAQGLGVSDRVKLIGELTHKELAPLLRSSDVFVRPSKSEGLGNAFLEAMAAGVPVVGSAVGGIPDFLVDGVTGLYCNPDDPTDIADKINNIIDNESLAQKLVHNARNVVVDRYSWSVIAQQMRKIYNHFI